MPAASIPGIELGVELGRGSHSVVLRGRRDGRDYAVKLPVEAATDADREVAYRRFLREAIALARARDASLPEVMEIGRSKGVPFLVMELAPGETLAERLERGPLSETDLVGLARHLAGALTAIHAAGLVHRDVKPQNVVFDARTGVARLIDLGSAALLHGAVGLVGTPAYAAPELLTGAPRAADVRTDLYSLGRVLFDCMGRIADAGNSSKDAAVAPDRGIGGIVERLLSSDPSQRHSNAVELRREVDALTSSAVARPAPWRGQTQATPSLAGRAAEIDQLRHAWANARRVSQVVFLKGAPGSGKTRLATAFVSEVAGGPATIFVAACHPRDPRAFSAVRQLIDGYLRRTEQLPEAERADAFAEIRKLGGAHGALLKLLSPSVARLFQDAPTIPASANAEEAFAEGLSEFLGKLIRRSAPALVFVDDVQWLDPSSRRVLARALVNAPKRVLFLYGARTGDAADDVKRFTDMFVAKTATLELRPVGGDDLVEIAREFLSAREVSPELKQAVLRLSDGTPLSVLELMRTLVDEGVLLPHWGRWQLDARALAEMHLPRETASLLARRIGALDSTTRSVLESAAVVGMEFDEPLVSAAAATNAESVAIALSDARRAELIEVASGETHRFIHHTVRDVLLAALHEQPAQEIHSRVAEALDDPAGLVGEEADADRAYRLAYHFGAGGSGCSPERVSETNVAAGRAAVTRFDNERAIEFFETAESALGRVSRSLAPEVRLLLGEARLRSGALDRALAEFDAVLSGTGDALLSAGALVRIATIHEMRFDSNRAWTALEKAFLTLGERLPKETAIDAAASAASWVRRSAKKRSGARVSSRARDEMLCALYYQVGRVAFSSNNPGRLILSTLLALEPAERLGPSPALAKIYLVYSFILTVLGVRRRGQRYFDRAERMAREVRDPVVYAHALQIQAVIAAWDGRMGDAVDVGGRCLVEYGTWRELSEFCLLAWTVYQIEMVRGRDLDAWRRLDLAIQRVNRHEAQPVVHEFLLLAARGALLALGRDGEARLLLRRIEQVTVAVPKDSDTYVWTFGPRIRVLTERCDLDADFDELNRKFRELRQNPKQAHLSVFEYYLHAAHARVHACLRAKADERSAALSELSAAAADLEAAARKIPLFRAHAVAVRGYEHWFHGRGAEALLAFEEAERIAVAEDAPWVLYAVHRGRAHLLRARGREEAARDQAVLAESIAREHGSVWRAKWIREEFGLRPRLAAGDSDDTPTRSVDRSLSDETASLLPGVSRARRQLRALVRISQARAQDLQPDLQARLVVDEIVQALRAERGFLLLSPAVAMAAVESSPHGADRERLEVVAVRDAAGRDIDPAEDIDQATVRGAAEVGADATGEIPASFCVGTTPRRSAVAVPLVVDEMVVGVLYVDRALGDGVFTEADGEVLSALAGQVSIALELARALRARERAEEIRRAADKMEAVARLARGVGHDVNNMLSAVSLTTEAMAQTPGADQIVGDDIRAIQSILKGAAEVARSLRDIGQGSFGQPEVLDVSVRVERLAPVIAGLLGSGISLDTRLSPGGHAFIDPGQLDQIVTNLAINARDAMSTGGCLTVEVSEVELDDAYARLHPRVLPGPYVRLSVVDTGHGMDSDVRDKIFEPYFTTKGKRGGTGLGLSSVYWIVSRSGGHIDVSSEPGSGTTFSLYFPATGPAAAIASEASTSTKTDARTPVEPETGAPSAGTGRTRAHT